jgi:hypothetical protein
MSEGQLWALLQRGVLRSGSGNLSGADEDLNAVLTCSERSDHQVSARHQLGVVALRRAKYEEAREIFEDCLTQRRDFRIVYELRRLVEVCIRLKDETSAERYRRELAGALERWRFDRIEAQVP